MRSNKISLEQSSRGELNIKFINRIYVNEEHCVLTNRFKYFIYLYKKLIKAFIMYIA